MAIERPLASACIDRHQCRLSCRFTFAKGVYGTLRGNLFNKCARAFSLFGCCCLPAPLCTIGKATQNMYPVKVNVSAMRCCLSGKEDVLTHRTVRLALPIVRPATFKATPKSASVAAGARKPRPPSALGDLWMPTLGLLVCVAAMGIGISIIATQVRLGAGSPIRLRLRSRLIMADAQSTLQAWQIFHLSDLLLWCCTLFSACTR